MSAISRATRAAAIVLTIAVCLVAAAVVGVQTGWFKNWLRGYIVRQASNFVNGEVSIERLGGNLFTGVKLENVTLNASGRDVVTLENVALRYSVFEIVSQGLSIDEIALARPSLYVSQGEDGSWSLSGLIKNEQSEADRQGPGRPIHIGRIGISDGTVVLDAGNAVSRVRVPKRIERLDARLSFDYEPIHYTVNVDHVSFRSVDPDVALNAFSGGVAVRDDTVFLDKLAIRTAETSMAIDGAIEQYLASPVARISISSDKVSLPELARLFPALDGIDLQPAFELKADGPVEQLRANLNMRSAAGSLLADVVLAYTDSAVSAEGTANVSKGDLARWLNRPDLESELTGKLTFDVKSAVPFTLQSLTGTATIATPRIRAVGYSADKLQANLKFAGGRTAIEASVAAYNARATTQGTVWLPVQHAGARAADMSTVRYDLHGWIQRLDFREIPIPANLRVPTDLNGEYRARGGLRAVEASVRFAPSQVASTHIGADSRADVAFDAGNVRYEADVHVAGLNPREAGRIFDVAALDEPRFEGSVSTQAVVRGNGTRLDDLDVNAEATVFDSRLGGAYISQAWLSGRLAGATAQLAATGDVSDLNPARLGAPPTADGTLAGSFDVQASLSGVYDGFDPDRLAARVRIDLEPSNVGPLRIDEGVVDAHYADSAADINELVVKGEDLNVDVSGRLSLGHDQGSQLYFAADSTQLKTIGDALTIPLTGIGRVSGTVSGDHDRFNVAGSLIGNGVSYGSMQALTLNSDYEAEIPDLRPLDATLKTKNHATFAVVGGQHLNELEGTAQYQQQEVTFDATAKQPARTASANGSLRLLRDRQQIRLQHLALQTEGHEWQTAAEHVAEIEYGGDTISIKDLELTSGDQRISVQGTFGGDEAGVTAHLENVDLAGVDALLLRPPQFSGRLDATAHVTGTQDEPRVTADFAVARGGFRKFQYDELRGSAEYQPAGVTVDARLQQNPSAFLTAKGSVPSALFNRDEETGSAAAPVDFQIESSGVDLGIVQGFTTSLTDVRGALQANLHVSGTADNPQASGAVTVADGALTVGPTGTKYSAINARLDLRGDRIELTDVRLLDNDKDAATVSGTLSLRARNISGIEVDVHTDGFDVLDNEFGQMGLNSDLRLTGDLANPRLEGNLGVDTGRLELDRILALVGNSAYALKETEYQDSPEQAAANTAAVPRGLFGALAIDVEFDVPDDLVVRASDLKAPGATLGLGAMNVTVGGDLHARKDPDGAVKLTGTVNTVRGTYDFQDRRFEILRDGTVRFAGLEELNPTLGIQARRIIQGVEANVNIEGTLQRPRIRLSSVPPLEEAEVLALIVFNQPLNQLGEGQQVSLAQRAAGLAEGAIAGQLAGTIGRALNLDTFEIQTAGDTGGAQVTAGQQISPRAYVKLQQGIGDVSQTNFVFEYQFLNWLRLESNYRVGNSIQQALFNRVQDTGADLVIQLPRQKQ